jgi:subtilisin family serine protease
MGKCKKPIHRAVRHLNAAVVLVAVAGAANAANPPAAPVMLDGQRVIPNRIIAKYRGAAQAQAAGPALATVGMQVGRRMTHIPRVVILEETGGATLMGPMNGEAAVARLRERLAVLRKSGLFEYVEPDVQKKWALTPNDTRFRDGTLWGLRNIGQSGGLSGADINAVPAWDITVGNTNIIVAVVDSGIRYTHLDLNAQMWRNPTETPGNGRDDDGDGYVDNVFGINGFAGTGDPNDDVGHGTHVAGTIGAAANNNRDHVGVAWNVRLMALKSGDFFGPSLSGIISCIDFAIARGAKVINASYGGFFFSQAEFDAVSRANNAGMLFVAAAGNESNNNDLLPAYPASFNLGNIISVAALDRFDRMAAFSNFGRASVQLGAPGVEIFSTYNGSDTDYTVLEGTSMAAPHVAGVAALVFSLNPTPSLSEVRTRLLNSVTRITALATNTVTGGRVNAHGALTLGQDGIMEISVTPSSGSGLLGGTTVPFTVRVEDLFGINNAIVLGDMPGVFSNRFFLNDGVAPDGLAGDSLYTRDVTLPAFNTNLTLTLYVSAPGKSNATATFTYRCLTVPTNDNFAAAFKIPDAGGLVLGDTTFSTTEVGEPLHAGAANRTNSIWYYWSPVESGAVLFDLAGSTFDTVLGIYTGNALGNLVEVASVDDVGTRRQGYVGFNASAGTTYRIAVAGVSASEFGQTRLRVEFGGVPDTNAPTVAITSPVSGIIVTNGQLTVTGTAADGGPGPSGVAFVQVQLNGDIGVNAAGSNTWSIPVALQPGTNQVQVRSFDFAGNASAPATVQVTYRFFDPPNDNFITPLALSAFTNGTVTVITAGATTEFGEPLHDGKVGGKSAWFTFVPASDGVLSLTTLGSTFDTLLGVYTGTRVDQLTRVASNDDAANGVTHSAVAPALLGGQTYWIAVDGLDGASGIVVLGYAFTPVALRSVTLNVSGNGALSHASGAYTNGSVLLLRATPALNNDFVSWQGGLDTLDNPIVVNVQSNTTLTATFLPKIFSDNFESGTLTNLAWAGAGNVGWSVTATNASETNTAAGGRFFARSGVIGNSQSSVLRLTAAMLAGPGQFAWRASTEAGFDFFSFSLNGVVLTNVSGDTGWQVFTFNVPAGTNTLEWRFTKDAAFSGGLDGVFIDNVELPIAVPKDFTVPVTLTNLFLSAVGPAGVTPQFRVRGQTNQVYHVQASSDLFNWETVATNIARHGVLQFTDAQATNFPTRYYRVIVP